MKPSSDTQWTFGAVAVTIVFGVLIGTGVLAVAAAIGQIVQHRLAGF